MNNFSKYLYKNNNNNLTQNLNKNIFIPINLRKFILNRIFEFFGIIIIISIIYSIISIIYWKSSDPSFNNATSIIPTNIMGLTGAYLSDFLIQTFGLTIGFMFIPLIVIGLKLICHKIIKNLIFRIIILTVAGLFLSGALSILPTYNNWPLSVGLGGISGKIIISIINNLFNLSYHTATNIISFIILSIFSLILGLYACGFKINKIISILFFINENKIVLLIELIKNIFLLINKIVLLIKDYIKNIKTKNKKVFHPDKKPWKKSNNQISLNHYKFEPIFNKKAIDNNNKNILNYEKKNNTTKSLNKKISSSNKRLFKLNDNFKLPSIEILTIPNTKNKNTNTSKKILLNNAHNLKKVLLEFGISGDIINISPGPIITLYELKPAPGIKSTRIISLSDDIARSMSVISARIAIIPGRNVLGIELPNKYRDTVYLKEIISSSIFINKKIKLPIALGKSIDGSPIIVDLTRMPHLLIAGTTGSGKSVGINSMILSILYKYSPNQCKIIMIDPKILELSIYNGIPHLLTPVISNSKKAITALKWLIHEMENRYKKMSKIGVKNIESYNNRIKLSKNKIKPLIRTVQTGFNHKTEKPIYEHETLNYKKMPFIIIIIDEMADLMLIAGKEIEIIIQRLTQMARAAGIHIIAATQRPSVDIITGSIKANFPARISFQVISKIDSRTILNEIGAEQLLGQGDMLYMSGGGHITRIHGAFVSDKEIENTVNYLKNQHFTKNNDNIILNS